MLKIVNNNLMQKIIVIVTLVVMIFTFICPTKSYAADLQGFIIEPFMAVIKFVFDVAEGVMQYYFIGGPVRTFWVMLDLSKDDYVEMLKSTGILDGGESVVKWQKPDEDDESLNISENAADFNNIFEKAYSWISGGTGYQIPMTLYSPEAIFSNKIKAFSIDFISKPSASSEGIQESIATKIRDNLADWYQTLRMLAAACMLPILIYVGIRIIISSASEKAKYKAMLMDWIVAMCLLFVMHYIMAIIINFTEAITNMISSATNSAIVVHMDDGQEFNTNLMGLVRFRAEYRDSITAAANAILYFGLVIYTFIFTWTYLKRTLMIAFLTLIAPIITITYPLDKLGDGKSQGFDIWLKEYLFNALIQPFHLLLYSVLIGASVSISVDNPIIAIAAMAFLLPAEKMLKKMFNFDKSHEGAAASNGFAGAFAGSLLANAKNLGRLNDKKSGGNGNGSSNDNTLDYLNRKRLNYKPVLDSNAQREIGLNQSSRGLVQTSQTANNQNIGGGFSVQQGENKDSYPIEAPEQSSNDYIMGMGESDNMQQYVDSINNSSNKTNESGYSMSLPTMSESGYSMSSPTMSERLNSTRNNVVSMGRQVGKVWHNDKFTKARRIAGKVGKIAAIGGMAAAGAAGGLILGSMTGDPANAIKGMATGATALGGVTRYTVKRIGSDAQRAMDSIRYRANPVKAVQKEQERAEREAKIKFMQDKTNKRRAAAVASSLGKENQDVRKVQEQMYELDRRGITSFKDQEKAIKMTDRNGEELLNNAWAIQKASKVDYNDKKERDKAIKEYMTEAESNGYSDKNNQLMYALKKIDLVRSVDNASYEGSTLQKEEHEAARRRYTKNI